MPKSPERCREIRELTRSRILLSSTQYFAKNGFAGTKISDLAADLGIGQGTLYLYFESKETLFAEIFSSLGNESDIRSLRALYPLPLPARHKLHKLTEEILYSLERSDDYAARVVLSARMELENRVFATDGASRQHELYRLTGLIIERGQKEGSVLPGMPGELSRFYWGVVYLNALKKLFDPRCELMPAGEIERIVLKEVR